MGRYTISIVMMFIVFSIININSAYATHRVWHILYAEPDSYCVDCSVCNGKKCKRQCNRYARYNEVPDCSTIDTTTKDTTTTDTTTTDTTTKDTTTTDTTTTVIEGDVLTDSCSLGNDTASFSINQQNYTLSWTPPTENADGTPLDDLVGYRIYFGTDPDGNFNTSFFLDCNVVTNINAEPGAYYIAMVAIDKSGYESEYSNIISITVN